MALQTQVDDFNAWFARESVSIAKIAPLRVTATLVPMLRIGVVTLPSEDVRAEEVYLGVPPSTLMDRSSAMRSAPLAPVYAALAKKFRRGDAFHELLIHLVYERFVLVEKSFWWPYLSLIPHGEEMMQPVWYSDDALKRLEGSTLRALVVAQKKKVAASYKAVKKAVFDAFPFFAEHAAAYTFANYKWAHAILDSRSIWWSGERHLCPMLDFVNCAQGPLASGGSGRRIAARVHSTDLDDTTGSVAVTKAPWAFPPGAQIFENYGQPNWIYFLHHGFSLDDNDSDCVRVPLVANGEEEIACLTPGAIAPHVYETVGKEGVLFAIEAQLRAYTRAYESEEPPSAATRFVRSEKKLLRALVRELGGGEARDEL